MTGKKKKFHILANVSSTISLTWYWAVAACHSPQCPGISLNLTGTPPHEAIHNTNHDLLLHSITKKYKHTRIYILD